MTPRFRDILFLLLWSVSTLVMGVLALPCLLLPQWSRAAAKLWTCWSLWLLKRVAGIHSHVRGYMHILPPPVIYAPKHQSTWDTLMLYQQLDGPAFVLKRSLYLIPIFGWYLWRSGQIAIDRKGGKRAIGQMVEQAKYYAGKGRSIVIFPEGTRRPPFAEPQYKFGVARVSEATGLKVVPVALNAGKVWPRHPIAKRAGHAIVEFLPTMPPAGTAREPWLKDLETRVETATRVLMGEA